MTKAKDPVAGAAETLLDADAAALNAVAPYRKTAPVKALSTFSELGDQPQMRLVCGALIAAGLLRRESRLVRAGTRMLAAHSLATLAKNVVKKRIDRTRPRQVAEGNGNHRMKPGDNRAKEETSFPSGHSAGAIAVAQAFGREYPEYRAPALAAAGAIALAQIPRCAHYPTDVGAGLAIGLLSEAAVDLAWRKAAERLEEAPA